MENNIVGHGGSGTVYRIALSSGEQVAVKKLWSRATKNPSPNQLYLDKELKTEVETLGSIRHKNIVKLYCCFSSMDYKLLVYEYMPNGNLMDALHNDHSTENQQQLPKHIELALKKVRQGRVSNHWGNEHNKRDVQNQQQWLPHRRKVGCLGDQKFRHGASSSLLLPWRY